MKYYLKIYRGTPGKQYWETFPLSYYSGANLISALMEIQEDPINHLGERVTPVAWEQGCLEEVCGSCSMLVNGIPRQACTALVQDYLHEKEETTITLAPLTKFPLIRDLVVDRSRMFTNLKQVQAWVETTPSSDTSPGPRIPPKTQELIYSLSTCMTCGCCLEACPQVNSRSAFIGPAALSQARLFNAHPTAHKEAAQRLHSLMEEGGVSECGNAQNCVEVCPKRIPLTESIAKMGREVTLQAWHDLVGTTKDGKSE